MLLKIAVAYSHIIYDRKCLQSLAINLKIATKMCYFEKLAIKRFSAAIIVIFKLHAHNRQHRFEAFEDLRSL